MCLPTCSCHWGVTTPRSIQQLVLAEWLKHGRAVNRNHVIGHFKQNFPKPECGGCYPGIILGIEVILDKFATDQTPAFSEFLQAERQRLATMVEGILAENENATVEDICAIAVQAMKDGNFKLFKLGNDPLVELAHAMTPRYKGFGQKPLETFA